MQFPVLITLSVCILNVLAQSTDATTTRSSTSTRSRTTTISIISPKTSTTITAIPTISSIASISTISNTTYRSSNRSMVTVTLSASSSYHNTSMTIPTSIIAATGTPILPGSGATITSYEIVGASTASSGGVATASPTQQNTGVRNTTSICGVVLGLLVISALIFG